MFIRRSKSYPNVILLLGDGINSPLELPIIQQCFGLVIDEKKNYAPVCYGYDRIFHYNELEAAAIDWSSIRVFEKLDGCLAILFFYDNAWRVASKESAFGTNELVTQITEDKLYYFSHRYFIVEIFP